MFFRNCNTNTSIWYNSKILIFLLVTSASLKSTNCYFKMTTFPVHSGSIDNCPMLNTEELINNCTTNMIFIKKTAKQLQFILRYAEEEKKF